MAQTVRLGTREYNFPSQDLQQLEDCNNLLGNYEGLKKELEDKGYLFIRGLHQRDDILAARLAVLEYIKSTGDNKLDAAQPWENGILDKRCGRGCVPFMEGKNSITHNEAVLKVIEGTRPKEFFNGLFGEPELTFDFKWLRCVYNEAFTGVHVDNVYMSHGTDQVCTMWTPFGDVTMDMGTLVVCEGSHKLPGFRYFQETYGNLDVEEANLKGSGWFTEDPFEITQKFGGQWKTSDFNAGDVLIFTLRTVHMSTVNTTPYARISCDTRWQPASQKVDDRFMGDFPWLEKSKFGLWSQAEMPRDQITMEVLRQKWGLQ